MEPTDSELVVKAIAGDRIAFDDLVSRYRSRIYYLILSKVRSRESALDLAQEAFVQAYLSLPTLKYPDKFASWVASIASNVCASYQRKPSEVLLPGDVIEELYESQSSAVRPDTDVDIARNILYSLPNGTRSAAVLYFIDEMKMTEIADFLDIPLSAVKSRIRDARSRIQKEMVYMVKRTAKKEELGDEFNRSLSHRLELARWYRELGELFDSGVNVRNALARLMEADYSQSIKNATRDLDSAVASGSSISDALTKLPALVAPDVIPMMRAGETGGMLEWAAGMLADRIELEEARQDIELSFWCQALGKLLRAGVPAVDALGRVAEISRSEKLKEATTTMAESVRQGQTIRAVLDSYTDIFTPKLRVVILAFEFSSLAYVALGWAGTEIALGICRRLVGGDVNLPSSDNHMIRPAVQHMANEFVGLLADNDPTIRAADAEMIGRFKIASAAPEIIKLVEDPEPAVMKAAMRALVDLESAPSANLLTDRLGDTDSSVRRAAVQALAELKLLHEAVDAVAGLIADPDERVAGEALSALESGEEIESLGKWAIEKIQDKENPRNREKAAMILFKHPTIMSENVLLIALADDLPTVRYTAAKALGLKGDKRATSVLREAVKERALSQDYLFLADDLEKG